MRESVGNDRQSDGERPSGTPFAVFWLFFFAGQGVFFPYFSLYLRENAGLSGIEVGLVLAVVPLAGMTAQPLWGQLADRTGKRRRVLGHVALLAAAGYLLIATADGFLSLFLTTALMAVFGTAVVPLGISASMAGLGVEASRRFGHVRVWGTVGFLVLVLAFPQALHLVQAAFAWSPTPTVSEPGLRLLLPIVSFFVALAACTVRCFPASCDLAIPARRGDAWRLLRHPPVRRQLLVSFVAFFSLQGPIFLFPVYVRHLGGDMDMVGRMWIPMILLEIPLVALSGARLQRLGPRGLIAIGTLVGGLRWLVCASSTNLVFIYAAQLVHGFVVAGLMVGGPLYLEESVPPQLRSTGQAMISTAGQGLGGITSMIVCGWLIDHVDATAPYLLGGIVATAIGGLVPFLLPQPYRPASG